jgi:hypothetical protein
MGRCVVLQVKEKWLERLLFDALGAWGFEARLATDAPGLGSVGLVIADLPDAPSEIAARLRDLQPVTGDESIPLVGIVANESGIPAALTYGAAACLSLPIDLDELRQVVEGLGRGLALTKEAGSRHS